MDELADVRLSGKTLLLLLVLAAPLVVAERNPVEQGKALVAVAERWSAEMVSETHGEPSP